MLKIEAQRSANWTPHVPLIIVKPTRVESVTIIFLPLIIFNDVYQLSLHISTHL